MKRAVGLTVAFGVALLILSPIAFAAMSSHPPTWEAPKPNLVLSAGTWNSGNLTISLASIVNAPNLAPADLTYLVQASDGTTYFSGPAGTGSAVSDVTATISYQDNWNAEKVSYEDSIRVTVAPSTSTAIRGGSFKIFFSGDVIGFINQLP